MTLYGNNNNAPVGGIMSPFQGTTPGVAGGATVQLPSGMPLLVAESLGLVPANVLVNTVNSISVGAQGAGGDPVSVVELLSTGNGNQSMRGTSSPPSGAISDQQFEAGVSDRASALANGPDQFNTEPLTLGPVSAGTLCQNVSLLAGGFAG